VSERTAKAIEAMLEAVPALLRGTARKMLLELVEAVLEQALEEARVGGGQGAGYLPGDEHLILAEGYIDQHDADSSAAVNPYLPIAHALVALVKIERATLRVLRREVRVLEADRQTMAAGQLLEGDHDGGA
jgi:hypothetical protein